MGTYVAGQAEQTAIQTCYYEFSPTAFRVMHGRGVMPGMLWDPNAERLIAFTAFETVGAGRAFAPSFNDGKIVAQYVLADAPLLVTSPESTSFSTDARVTAAMYQKAQALLLTLRQQYIGAATSRHQPHIAPNSAAA